MGLHEIQADTWSILMDYFNVIHGPTLKWFKVDNTKYPLGYSINPEATEPDPWNKLAKSSYDAYIADALNWDRLGRRSNIYGGAITRDDEDLTTMWAQPGPEEEGDEHEHEYNDYGDCIDCGDYNQDYDEHVNVDDDDDDNYQEPL